MAKNKGGRPSAYYPGACDDVEAFMADGFTLAAFAGSIGVSRGTVDNWRDSHPEFDEAVGRGQAKQALFFERQLHRLIRGGKGSTVATIFALRNVSDTWRTAERERNARDVTPLLEAPPIAEPEGDGKPVVIEFVSPPPGMMVNPDGTFRKMRPELLAIAREIQAEGLAGPEYDFSDPEPEPAVEPV